VIELVRTKQGGKTPKAREAPRPSNVVNLMDALRRSIEVEQPATVAKKTPPRTSTGRSARKPTASKRGRAGIRKAS
jgi:DNA end-binding protein Ku